MPQAERIDRYEILRKIATGGMAELIAPYAPCIEIVDPLLTLEGLRILHGVACGE